MNGRKIRLVIEIIVLLSLLIGVVLYYYLFFTPRGSGTIVKLALSNYVESEDMTFEKIDGALTQKTSLQNIEFKDIKGLPRGSILKIQALTLYYLPFDTKSAAVEIENGRLTLPYSSPLFFYGTYKNSSLDFTIYAHSINIREIFDLFAESEISKKLSGRISNFEAHLKSSSDEPELTGKFRIENLSYNSFSVVDSPADFTLKLKDIKEKPTLYGEIMTKSGMITARKTVMELQQSRIFFSGEPQKPSFDVRGTSLIEGIKIAIALKGTMDAPHLKLTSEPPMSEAELLVILATGKRWKGVEATFAQGKISPDLAVDFIDYFVFGGSGSKMTQRLGVSNISLTYDEQTRGIGVKKKVSNKVEVGYGVEESQMKKEAPQITHRVETEYKITETQSISLGGEKEVIPDKRTEQTQEKPQTDDKVFLKYKKKF